MRGLRLLEHVAVAPLGEAELGHYVTETAMRALADRDAAYGQHPLQLECLLSRRGPSAVRRSASERGTTCFRASLGCWLTVEQRSQPAGDRHLRRHYVSVMPPRSLAE